MTSAAGWIEKTLDYRFRDNERLSQALTHRSAGGRHNERLEFLGDAVLGMIIAETLFLRVPDAEEGYLTRLRANLVRRETLAEIGAEIGLGDWLRLGAGELGIGLAHLAHQDGNQPVHQRLLDAQHIDIQFLSGDEGGRVDDQTGEQGAELHRQPQRRR